MHLTGCLHFIPRAHVLQLLHLVLSQLALLRPPWLCVCFVADVSLARPAPRLFFCTPQSFANDLATGAVNPLRIVLVVFDEAHRASGQYAYCTVIKELDKHNPRYRVLALSATPGTEVSKVQDVINELHISHIEVQHACSCAVCACVRCTCHPFIHQGAKAWANGTPMFCRYCSVLVAVSDPKRRRPRRAKVHPRQNGERTATCSGCGQRLRRHCVPPCFHSLPHSISQIHEVTVPLSKEFTDIRESFLGIMKLVLNKLAMTKATTETNPEKLNSMMLLQLKESLHTCVWLALKSLAQMWLGVTINCHE